MPAPVRCKVCLKPDVAAAIRVDLVGGASEVATASKFGFSRSMLKRHLDHAPAIIRPAYDPPPPVVLAGKAAPSEPPPPTLDVDPATAQPEELYREILAHLLELGITAPAPRDRIAALARGTEVVQALVELTQADEDAADSDSDEPPAYLRPSPPAN